LLRKSTSPFQGEVRKNELGDYGHNDIALAAAPTRAQVARRA